MMDFGRREKKNYKKKALGYGEFFFIIIVLIYLFIVTYPFILYSVLCKYRKYVERERWSRKMKEDVYLFVKSKAWAV